MIRALAFALFLLLWTGPSAHAQLFLLLEEGAAEAGAAEVGAAEAAAARAAAAEAAAERAAAESEADAAAARRNRYSEGSDLLGESVHEGLDALSSEVNRPTNPYGSTNSLQPYGNGNNYRQYNGSTTQQQYNGPENEQQCWTEYRRELIGRDFDHREFAGRWVEPNGVVVTRWRNVFLNHWRVYPITHCG